MAYRDSYDSPFGQGVPPVVKYLLIANAIVFLLTLIPGAQSLLSLRPSQVLWEPWTPFTYMFVHAGGFHLLFNLIALFFFGRPLEERWGSQNFLKFYIVCGLGGALLSFLTPNATILGASAAVNGVLLAFAMIWPEEPIHLFGILPVKAKWLVAFIGAFSVLAALTGTQPGVAHWAHLGGFAAGFLYLKTGLLTQSFAGYGASHRKTGKGILTRLRDALPSRRKSKPSSATPTPTAKRDVRNLDDVDRILDKISAQGLGSLTADERKRLDEVSRRYRT